MSFKVKVILSSIIVVIIVIVILLMNKKSMQEKVLVAKQIDYEVVVQNPTMENISDELSIVGNVIPNSEISLLSETAGKVISVSVNVGEKVAKNQVIAKVDDELKKAAFITAKVNYEKAKKDFERIKNLFDEKNATQNDVEMASLNLSAAEAQFIVAQRQLNDATIKSPINGVIAEKFINVGSTLAPGMPVVSIIDNSVLKILIKIPENYINLLCIGQNVVIKSDLYPQKSIIGKISTISPKADFSHNFTVEVTFTPTKDMPLKAGMFATVEIKSDKVRSAIMLPRKAIIGSLKEAKVYVVVDNKAYIKDIVVGSEYNGKVEVVQGLTLNDIVVIGGQNNLSNNVSVRITNN